MADDFSGLAAMKYSGRGITLGVTPEGNPFVGYTLTGRSPSSQARELVYDDERKVVYTDVTDRAQLEKGSPALLIYPAIALAETKIVASKDDQTKNGAQTKLLYKTVASNGAQTKLLYKFALESGGALPEGILREAMRASFLEHDKKEGWIDIASHEPDSPNFTPRISGCIDRMGNHALHIVSRDERFPLCYEFKPEAGVAHIITTYKGGNEKPLLGFEGKPLEARVESINAGEICRSLFDAIGHPNPDDDNKVYRVAAAVMMFRNESVDVVVRNRDKGE